MVFAAAAYFEFSFGSYVYKIFSPITSHVFCDAAPWHLSDHARMAIATRSIQVHVSPYHQLPRCVYAVACVGAIGEPLLDTVVDAIFLLRKW